jgi:hypothetical protein
MIETTNQMTNGYTITYIVPFHIWALPVGIVLVGLVAIAAAIIVLKKRKLPNA